MRGGPRLEEVEVLLSRAAGQVVAPALEQKLATRAEADAAVGPVDLLLDDQVPPGDVAERHGIKILVAGLKPGTFDVLGARVLLNQVHGSVLDVGHGHEVARDVIERHPSDAQVGRTAAAACPGPAGGCGRDCRLVSMAPRARQTGERPGRSRPGLRERQGYAPRLPRPSPRRTSARRKANSVMSIRCPVSRSIPPIRTAWMSRARTGSWSIAVTGSSGNSSNSGQRKAPRPLPTSSRFPGAKDCNRPKTRRTRARPIVRLNLCISSPAACPLRKIAVSEPSDRSSSGVSSNPLSRPRDAPGQSAPARRPLPVSGSIARRLRS